MGGCLRGLQTAPLSRLHNRVIEPIENIGYSRFCSALIGVQNMNIFYCGCQAKK